MRALSSKQRTALRYGGLCHTWWTVTADRGLSATLTRSRHHQNLERQYFLEQITLMTEQTPPSLKMQQRLVESNVVAHICIPSTQEAKERL